MEKVLISLILIAIIIGLSYILKDITITDSLASNDRIIKILDEGSFEIYVDKKTRVMYLQSNKGCGYQGYGGLTVMLNAEGKPLLYED